MPIIKSAIKRARQATKRRSHNLKVLRAVSADIKAVQTAIEAGDTAQINETLAAAYSEIDRAVKKGTIHKNTAARRKSQLATNVAKVVSPQTKAPKAKTDSSEEAPAKKPAAKKTPAKKPAAKKATTKKSA